MRSNTPLALQSAMLIDRQKDHGHAIGAGLGQLDPQFPALARKKDMRNLDQDACAVARFRIATRSATMCELEQDLKALTDDLVAFFSANAGNKAHSARVVLVTWMVKPLWRHTSKTTIGLFNRCMAAFR